MINSGRGRVLLGLAIAAGSLAALFWYLQRRWRYDEYKVRVDRISSRPTPSPAESPSPVPPTPTPEAPSPSMSVLQSSPNPAPTALPETVLSPTPWSAPDTFVWNLKLIIPVAGVRPEQLRDTFADARSEGRVHDAIDIPAPPGTPVLAAADGEIIKLFQSERGGTTIYELSTDKKLVFYYAHLQGYADGISPGKFVHQGETIAYVGDTGNAGTGNYHLHFSIAIVADPRRYWEGTNINPYPWLRR
jgi:peptidoglycan LD-endopeptidase LytH